MNKSYKKYLGPTATVWQTLAAHLSQFAALPNKARDKI
jgi:hypothetical protein